MRLALFVSPPSKTEQPILLQYDFVSVEKSMYKWWEAQGYFKPGGDPTKKSYVVPMPPPNVTGYLHMGHAMGTTLQVGETICRCLFCYHVHASRPGRRETWQVADYLGERYRVGAS